MIEPTESETKATLERFADALKEIDRLVDDDPQSLLDAPQNTPVGRLDETRANRQLDVRWRPSENSPRTLRVSPSLSREGASRERRG